MNNRVSSPAMAVPATELDKLGTAQHDNLNIASLQQTALARFQSLGIPTTRQEEWRFTSLKPLHDHQYVLPEGQEAFDATLLQDFLSFAGYTMVFVNGHYRPEISSISQVPAGLTVSTLASAIENNHPAVNQYLAKLTVDEKAPFQALNTGLFHDGLFVYVPADTVVEAPIQVIYAQTSLSDVPVISPRTLIIAERHSQTTIIETFVGTPGARYLTTAVLEAHTAEDAIVDHYRIQLESTNAFHFATLEANIERAGHFRSHVVTLGGGLVRNDIGYKMAGTGGTGTMNGVYQIGGTQLVDNHTRIDHAEPNCETHEFYKGVLDGNARGVFNGSIMVRQIAQKTNAKQTNRNMLLSPNALINTNPQLEIFADDVKCTHGATIGQLDEAQLYYLRSRGIDLDAAKRILTYAFANEVVEQIKLPNVRAYVENQLLRRQAAPAQTVIA